MASSTPESKSEDDVLKLPAKPNTEATAAAGSLSRMPSITADNDDNKNNEGDCFKLPAKPQAAAGSLSRIASITAPAPTWFRSMDWFRSTDSATGILRDEVFKSDVSFDIAVLDAATASGNGASASFPPPLASVAARGRTQSATSTSSQDSWLRKMLMSQDSSRPVAGPLARNTSTSSQNSLMQKVYDASKSAIAKMCTSGDWAPDLTLHDPLLNVADVFKTSNENKKLPAAVPVPDVNSSMNFQLREPHEELAAALKMANAVAVPRHGVRAAAVDFRATAASSSADCFVDFMKEMQAACAPASAATTTITKNTTTIVPPAFGIGSGAAAAVMPPVTVSSSGAAAISEHGQRAQVPSRKRTQEASVAHDDLDVVDDFIYVEPSDKDVLMGRGGRTNNHPGNKQYLKVKDEMQKRYLEASKQDKTPISQELVDQVHAWGGRFLQLADKKDKNGKARWYEVDPVTARKKCSQSLREINTPEVRKAKRTKYCKA